MIAKTKVAPEYNLIFVQGIEDTEPPLITGLVSANAECIAVGTTSYVDGETTVILGDMNEVRPSGKAAVYHGSLRTPDGHVSITDALGTELLKFNFSHPEAKVQVWVDDPSEPKVIRIGLAASA